MSCDGLFLIYDTAAHIGLTPDPDEITDHLADCAECFGEIVADFDHGTEIYA